jgi:hypothetical protein
MNMPEDKRRFHEKVQEKYGAAISSPLAYTIIAGEQTKNLDLD